MEPFVEPALIKESINELTTIMTPHHWSNVFIALVVLGACWFIGNIVKKQIAKLETPEGHSTLFISLGANIAKALCVGLGILFFIGILGIDVSAIIKMIAILGFGVSVMFRDIIHNVMSGFFIAGYKSFTLGTEVTITLESIPYTGTIKTIDLCYITLDTATQKILIPNSFFARHAIRISKEN